MLFRVLMDYCYRFASNMAQYFIETSLLRNIMYLRFSTSYNQKESSYSRDEIRENAVFGSSQKEKTDEIGYNQNGSLPVEYYIG